MITSNIFKGKKILILGLGITGTNLYKALTASKAKVYTWDDNNKILSNIQKNINLKNFKFNQLDYCIPSPGISTVGLNTHPLISLLKKNCVKIISELDLFQIYLNSSINYLNGSIKVIATTGTNGKSTVVSIINHVLQKLNYDTSLIGNIGKSIFQSRVLKKGFYIIEASSYQLETTSIFRPNISILTNISEDHILRHKTLNNYVKQKFKIFQNLSDNDSAIISNDHYITKKLINKISNKKRFNLIKVSGKNKKSTFYYDDSSIYKNNKFIYKSSNPNLYGSHNLENISLVVAFLSEIDRLNKKSLKAINSFKGLSHRQEILRKINKTTFINDSKATNIDSSIPALKSFKNIHWICGGIPKSHDMKLALPYLKNVKKIYVIGLEKDIFFAAFERYIEVVYLRDMKKAVQSAFSNSKKEKKISTVLLSPAAASFDQYKNFETRGNAFKKCIMNL